MSVTDVEFTGTNDSFGFGLEGGLFDLELLASGPVVSSFEVDLDGDGVFDLFTTDYATEIGGALLLDAASVTTVGGGDNGTYPGLMRVVAAAGGSETYPLPLIIGNAPPDIGITGTLNPAVSAAFTLSLSTTDPGPDTISALTIDWGDGTQETPSVFSGDFVHAYATSGEYIVDVTFSDEDGSYRTWWDVGVGDLDEPDAAPAYPLIADAQWSSSDGVNITLTASATDENGNAIVHGVNGTYEWDLDGDGSFTDASGETVQVTLPFAVQVRVTDTQGNTNEALFTSYTSQSGSAGGQPPGVNPFLGAGNLAAEPTLSTYRQNFIDKTPDMKSSLAEDWEVHHTLQVGRQNGETILADRFLAEKGINVHRAEYLRGVPRGIHQGEIKRLQNAFWDNQKDALSVTTTAEAMRQVDLDEVIQFADDMEKEMKDMWIKSGKKQKTAIRRINNAWNHGRGKWALGRIQRMRRMGLGAALGGIVFFDTALLRAEQMGKIAGGGGAQEWATLEQAYKRSFEEIELTGGLTKETAIDWKNALMNYWLSLGEDPQSVAKTSAILEGVIRKSPKLRE